MGNLRGVGNGAPVRLVSPAPVLINSNTGAQAAAANNMRLLGNHVISFFHFLTIFQKKVYM